MKITVGYHYAASDIFKIATLLAAALLYGFGFSALHGMFGHSAASAVLVPVALAGFFYGKKIGLIAGVSALPLNFFLFSRVGTFDLHFHFLVSLPPIIISLLVGIFTGWLSELFQRNKQQLVQLEQKHNLLNEEAEKRKSIERTLQRSYHDYRTIVENVKEVIFKTDVDGKWTFLNQAWTEVTGFAVEESIGSAFFDYVHPDDRHLSQDHFQLLLEGKQEYCRCEIRYLCKDQGYRWGEFFARRTFDNSGFILSTLGTLKDITERKEAEARLTSLNSELEKRVLERTVQLESDMLQRKQAEAELHYWHTFKQLVSDLSENFIDIPARRIDEEMNRSLRVIGKFTYVDRAYLFQISEDGTLISNTHGWCGDNGAPLLQNFKDQPVETFPWLQKEILRFEPVQIPSVAGMPDEASAEKEFFLQQGVQSLIIVPMKYDKIPLGSLAFESTAGTKEWGPNDILFLKMVAEIFANAIIRQRTEIKIQSAEQRLREVLAASNCFVYSCKVASGFPFTFVSENVKSILGYDGAEILATQKLGTNNIHDDDRSLWFSAMRQILKNDELNIEYRLRHKDGSYHWLYDNIKLRRDTEGRPVEIVGTAVDITERKEAEELYRLMFQCNPHPMWVYDIETGAILTVNDTAIIHYGYSREEFLSLTVNEIRGENGEGESHANFERDPLQKNVERRHRKKDGKIIDVEVSSYLMLFNGKKARFVLVNDVTERKQLELQLLRSQRMESIGTLAGGIAHDLNNALTPVMMWLEVLKEKLPDEKSQNILSLLESSTKRGSDMVRQVLMFARGVEGERMELQPVDILHEIQKLIIESLPKSIDVTLDFRNEPWRIVGDATQLQQVLTNLCVNARDAMPRGGKLSISCENIEMDEGCSHIHLDAKPGHYVMISVGDTGVGIPRNILDRIFDPFFTTKAVGKGTGLGLSSSLAIVKAHGGFINVHSEVDKGSVFKIYLPAVASLKSGHGTTAQNSELPRGKGELIMVVDDDPVIREVMKEILIRFGYSVITASDGTEAIPVYVGRQSEIKLVITDIMMPYMDGIATIRALRQINPGIKIIGTSGLAQNEITLEAMKLHVQGFVKKPFTAKGLRQILGSAFGNGETRNNTISQNELAANHSTNGVDL